MTAEKVALGKMLFFDRRLSVNDSISCATCHDPATAYAERNQATTGARGQQGRRNAPTVLNAMFYEELFWDGRSRSLEDQMRQPLLNPDEMGMASEEAVIAKLKAAPVYQRMFRSAFIDQGITMETLAKAIAAFERTRLSGNSPFDRFIAGDPTAITEAQKRGWVIFQGKGQCTTCHSFSPASPFFTDFKYHNTGIAARKINLERPTSLMRQAEKKADAVLLNRLAHQEDFTELGRFLVTSQPKDIGAFRTPSLRDVELTGPYMHDGSESTLLDVVRFYNQGGGRNANLDEQLHPLKLTDAEMNDLVDFLKALTSDDILKEVQRSKPQSRTPHKADSSV